MSFPDLHIVTFAVPYPATYGGAIDSWNRISALARQGVNIRLHCFVYSHFKPQTIFRELGIEVHYYPRKAWPVLFSKGQPYIVSSRKSPELLKTLSVDNVPVLFDGLHTTGFAEALKKGRKVFLRAHNIEHQYYSELADFSRGFKSLIFRREAQCLEEYEKRMAGCFDVVFAISPEDLRWYTQHGARTVYLPPFHGCDDVDILTGRGEFILYQGDLSIEINQIAVLDLVKRWADNPALPMVIAGRSGDKAFEEKLTRFTNLKREQDVSQSKMTELIKRAQMILIHSLHGSGMKVKIFPALFYGRHIAATKNCITHTPLDQAIHLYEPSAVNEIIKQLWPLDFSQDQRTERSAILAQHPGDLEKAKEFIRYL